jgi:hypothetical protein
MKWWRLEAKRLAPGSLFWLLAVAGLTVRVAPAAADASLHLLENGDLQGSSQRGAEAGVLNLRMYELERKRNYIEAIPVAERYAEVIRTSDGAKNLAYVATLNHLAILYRKTQQEAEAVAAHRKALSVLEELAAAEPGNPQWLSELAKCHISLAKAGDNPEQNYKKALSNLKELESSGKFEPLESYWVAVVESKLRKLKIERRFNAGEFDGALSIAEEEAQQRELEQSSGQGSVRATAEALNNVAHYALFARRPDKALKSSEKAVALAPNLTWLAINRAHALMFLGRREEALAAYREHNGESLHNRGDWGALVVRDFRDFRAHGLDHPMIPEIERLFKIRTRRMAKVQIARLAPCQDASDAVGLARCDVDNARTQYGKNHVQYGRALIRLASRLEERKQPAEAAPLYQQGVDILSHAFPPDHPYVGQLLLRLSDKTSKDHGMRILDSALKSDALAQRIDPDDASTARALEELADENAAAGRNAEAARARKVLSQRKGPLLSKSSINPDTVRNSVTRLEVSYARALGDDPFGDAVIAGNSAYQAQHAYYKAVMAFYRKRGDTAAASDFRARFIALSERMLREAEPNKAEVASILVSLSELYDSAQRAGDAENALRRAMAIQVSLQGPDGPEVAKIRARLTKHDNASPRKD